MDIIKWFGDHVSTLAGKDPVKARRLLLTGYRANTLMLKHTTQNQPSCRGEGAITLMKLMIEALSHPQNAAMVSLFIPCEPLLAAGITPYSVESIAAYLLGTRCETPFQELAAEQGMPETLCSYHRTFFGAATNGLIPPPAFMLYTNLACDGNMITFPALQDQFAIPSFFIDVPCDHTEDAVADVAGQLREMVTFIEDTTHQKIDPAALKKAVRRTRLSQTYYQTALAVSKKRRLPGSVTDEMYTALMGRCMLGSPQALDFFCTMARDISEQPVFTGKRLVWIHLIPNMQPALRQIMNDNPSVCITGLELCYDSILIPADENDPYRSMARRMVYSGYNGPARYRIDNALNVAQTTGADGCVVFAHWGCKETLGATKLMKDALEAAGYPTLILDGDGCCPANTGDGQMATRLQAFLELLEEPS
ncbi:MAG: 2-hydroxyacyl-CoA dehydratase family protein [Eubacteriaceae bacterium]|nr:2-hydroxyacyl-CoA dehydratase family protein [Eubacteriaceae bacterium]